MARQPEIARRAEQLLGSAVVSTAPVAGGDTSTATRLRLSDGTSALMKTHSRAPAGFFATEAAGLRWLRDAETSGGVATPEVLAVAADCLLLRWIEPTQPTAELAEDLGRRLAATHGAGADGFGAPGDGWIATLPLPQEPAPTWAEFFLERRVRPYLEQARQRGALTGSDAALVERVATAHVAQVPVEAPARLHGDLWNGNVVWGREPAGQTRAYLVDPAAYGGHRESDLAMLALFGLPHLARALAAYHEAAPLADGWEDRVGLHQLFPLLVHACLFGGGYGARAVAVAKRLA